MDTSNTRTIPFPLILICIIVALFAISPLVYLAFEASQTSTESWVWMFRMNTARILWRSIILAISVAGCTLLIATPIAFLTSRTNMPFPRFWNLITTLPLVIPSYVGAYIFVSLMGPNGLLQKALQPVTEISQFPGLYGYSGSLMVLTFLNYPYVLLTLRSAMSQIDPSEEESARILGLGRINTIKRITIPQIRPALLSSGLLVSLYTLSDFGAVSLLWYKTFTWSIYNQYEASFDRSSAALLSIILCLVATVFVYMESTTRGKANYFRTSMGVARDQEKFDIGWWKVPSILMCSVVAFISVVMPVIVLTYWLIRGISHGEETALNPEAIINSLMISILTASVVVTIITPIAYVATRYKSLFSSLVEKACFTGFALPSIAVAISLVFIGSYLGGPIYQSLFLLIFACVILYLPIGISPVKSTLLQISPRLEESSFTLGKGRFQTSLSVTLPLLKPGIAMAFALVFLVSMKELPAVLILSPLDFHTLTTTIWSYSSEAFFAKAAAPALTLILVSSLPLAIIFFKGGFRA